MSSSRYLAALGHRNFRLLWSGQAVSQLGDGVFTVALAIEALRIDHRATGLSVVLAARILPAVLFALIGGVLVDRITRRLVMFASDLARGVAVGVVCVLVAAGHIDLAGLIGLALVFGIADAGFYPASVAIIPELVPADLLMSASALSGTSFQLASVLIGPALGGLLIGLTGTASGFGIDAASFLISAAAIRAMTGHSTPVPSEQSPLADLRAGLRFCRSEPWLWTTTLGTAVGNFVAFSPLGVLIPLLVRHVLHGGGVDLGLVIGAGGLGGLIATVLVGRRPAPRHRLLHMWIGWGLSGVGVLGLGLAPDLWLAGVVAFVAYALDSYGTTMFNPLLQDGVPKALLGRVSSVDYVFCFALSPLGLIAGGFAAEAVGARATLIVGGAIAALTTLIPLLPGVEDPTLHSTEEVADDS